MGRNDTALIAFDVTLGNQGAAAAAAPNDFFLKHRKKTSMMIETCDDAL